ncbi:Hypothetical predicted protein [Podarcis lilfordi]|uniref:Uncharacterized protein n=1 Tax=Podarcis lilfordi TaxID=74358 RepID=A0AA35PBE5_9SAUR|nr:Hypothetical predicted protein [Podarcis lilfordi]
MLQGRRFMVSHAPKDQLCRWPLTVSAPPPPRTAHSGTPDPAACPPLLPLQDYVSQHAPRAPPPSLPPPRAPRETGGAACGRRAAARTSWRDFSGMGSAAPPPPPPPGGRKLSGERYVRRRGTSCRGHPSPPPDDP